VTTHGSGWPLAVALLAGAGLACSADDGPDPLVQELGVIGDDAEPVDDHLDDPNGGTTDADDGPAGVDADGFEAVLTVIEANYAEAIATSLEHGAVTDEAGDAVAAVFAPELGARIVAALQGLDDGERARFRPLDQLGPRVHTDIHVLEQTEVCAYLETTVDARPLVADAPAAEPGFVVLGVADEDVDGQRNPSGWVVTQLPTGEPDALRTDTRC
jgi:hypothetical protein